MVSVLEKGFYATLGAGMLAFETAKVMVSELVDKGKLAPEEGGRLLDDLYNRFSEEKEDAKLRFLEEIQTAAKNMELPTREDVERLSLAVEELTIRISLIEAKQSEAAD